MSIYDQALIIAANPTHQLNQAAIDFLEKYAANEEEIGDDDNPFNPTVSDQIRLEEEFENLLNKQ